MPNADYPRGLVPVSNLYGAPFNAAIRRFCAPATDATPIYIGGLVKIAGSADADGIMTVTGNVVTGDAVVGVVIGFDVRGPMSMPQGAASTLRYPLVNCDPNSLFEVQENSVGAPLAATAVGNSANLAGFTTGSAGTGQSAIQIASASATAIGTGVQDVVIVGLVQRPDNEIGALAKWYVRLNNHAFVDGFSGA